MKQNVCLANRIEINSLLSQEFFFGSPKKAPRCNPIEVAPAAAAAAVAPATGNTRVPEPACNFIPAFLCRLAVFLLAFFNCFRAGRDSIFELSE